MQQNNITKKQPPKMLIYILAALILAVLVFMAIPKTKAPAAAPVAKLDLPAWDKMTIEQKDSWLNNEMKTNTEIANEFEITAAHLIRNNFKDRNSVTFDISGLPRFKNGWVGDAEDGLIFHKGSGTAIDVYGLKSKFTFQLRSVLNTDTIYIQNVTVSSVKK